MTARAWLALCATAMILGALIGWSARTITTGDRYIRSLAEKHEATASYFNTKLDTMIQENERTFKHGK
ncbi:MAG: hypothetical protein M0023_04295 [Desulfobacteraceae bacterium]|nr:hypothetical protein [Desulfobacteraceae bacterium]